MPDSAPPPAAVRDSLAKIVGSPLFTGSECLSQFLRFVVEETLEGRGGRIKDYVIGVEVYRKDSSYDPRTDSSVRVEAGRLRAKLTRYYETDGKNDALVISVPKGTYVPTFASCERPPPPATEKRVHLRLRTGVTLALAATVLLVTIWAVRTRATHTRVSRVVPLTTYPGRELNPTFSLDGTQVAFSWDGGVNEGHENIYVKVIGSGEPLRLTDTPAREFSPAWSPDGRVIAFLRFLGPGHADIVAVSPLGGSETRLGKTASVVTPGYFPGSQLAWSPDGKWLGFADRDRTDESEGIFVLSLETGDKRRLTTVPSRLFRDRGPSFSPDGKWVAFCRGESFGISDIYLQALSRGYVPSGKPVRLTSEGVNTTAVSWMPDSRRLVFSSGGFEGERGIFTLDVTQGVRKRDQMAATPAEDGFDIAVSPDGRRAAYTRRLQDANIWRVELDGTRAVSSARRLIASSRNDQLPKISPDGKRVAFSSSREGTREIWISDADAAHSVQLTALGSRLTTNPAWSPGNREVAFDSRSGGVSDIFTVSSNGGVPRQLTHGPAEQGYPSWSHNGRWIYFHSGKGGFGDVWKVPPDGGEAVRVTTNRGGFPKESPDGKTLFFVKDDHLWKIPVGGGMEQLVSSEPLDEYNYDIASSVVFFIPPAARQSRMSIRFLRLDTGQSGEVLRLDKSPAVGLAVSPDGRWLLYSQFDQEGSDLILIDNFNPRQ